MRHGYCRSILRRGSRFNASDLSYQQPSKSAARARDETTTAVAEVAPRRRHRSTDVASRVALLASIPLDTHTSPARQQRTEQSLEASQDDDGHEDTDRQSPAALVKEHGDQSAHVGERCHSVSFDDDLQQSPNTDETRQVLPQLRTTLPLWPSSVQLHLSVPWCAPDCYIVYIFERLSIKFARRFGFRTWLVVGVAENERTIQLVANKLQWNVYRIGSSSCLLLLLLFYLSQTQWCLWRNRFDQFIYALEEIPEQLECEHVGQLSQY